MAHSNQKTLSDSHCLSSDIEETIQDNFDILDDYNINSQLDFSSGETKQIENNSKTPPVIEPDNDLVCSGKRGVNPDSPQFSESKLCKIDVSSQNLEDGLQKCVVCSEGFDLFHNAREHSLSHAYSCGKCDFNTFSHLDLDSHFAMKHPGCDNDSDKFYCLLCKSQHSKSTSKDAGLCLEQHISQVHGAVGPRVYQCNCCASSFGEVDELLNHERADHMEVRCRMLYHYKCEVCPRLLNSRSHFEHHSKAHAIAELDREEEIKLNEEISKPTKDSRMKVIEEIKHIYPSTCYLCRKRYTINHGAYDHSLLHCFCCLDCGFTTSNDAALKSHLDAQGHNEVKDGIEYHYCSICNCYIKHTINEGKKGKFLPNSKDHQIRHMLHLHIDMTRSYYCQLCKFHTKEGNRAMILHEKTQHNGSVETSKKHFRCKDCCLLLRSWIAFEKHSILHRKEKEYPKEDEMKKLKMKRCTRCREWFSSVKLKIAHDQEKHKKLVRIGAGNFRCNLCERNFTSEKSKIEHDKIKHSGKEKTTKFVVSNSVPSDY